MKKRPVGAEFFHADGRTVMTKLFVILRTPLKIDARGSNGSLTLHDTPLTLHDTSLTLHDTSLTLHDTSYLWQIGPHGSLYQGYSKLWSVVWHIQTEVCIYMEKLLLFWIFFVVEGLKTVLFIQDILLNILSGVKYGISQFLQTNSPYTSNFFPLVFHFHSKSLMTNHSIIFRSMVWNT